MNTLSREVKWRIESYFGNTRDALVAAVGEIWELKRQNDELRAELDLTRKMIDGSPEGIVKAVLRLMDDRDVN